MIRFKRKEYSSKTLRLIKKINKLGDSVIKKIDNKSLDIADKLSPSLNSKGVLRSNYRFSPKSNTQLNRESIELRNKVKQAAVDAVTTPVGKYIDKGIEYTVSSPVMSATRAGGAALMAIEPATALVPTSAIGLAAEAAAKNNKTYRKITEKLGKLYRNTKISKTLRKDTPSLLDLSGYMPIL